MKQPHVDPFDIDLPMLAADLYGRREPWMDDARCAQVDPEMFHPEKGGSTAEAKRVCASCPVRLDCLEYALKNNERSSIWGGLTERQRRSLRSKR